MYKNTSLFFSFLFFFILSVSMFFAHVRLDFLSTVLSPLQAQVFAAVASHTLTTADKKSLSSSSQSVQFQQILNENSALRDQFASTTVPSSSLLPSQIIGMPRFIPGVSLPETLVIDQGSTSGVHIGAAVVVKNVLIGEVTDLSSHTAIVTLITSTSISFTATTQKTDALGIAHGIGGGNILLQNVLLSDSLQVGDTVVTKGNQDSHGIGLPPDLLIGTIISVNKNPSALFQTAALKTPITIAKLDMVFVKVK